MNRVEELTFKVLDDDLTDAESSELERLLDQDAESARFHISLVEQEALLRAGRQPADLAFPIVRRIREEIRSREEKGVMDRIRDLQRPDRPPSAVIRRPALRVRRVLAAAAVLMLCFLIPMYVKHASGGSLAAGIVHLSGRAGVGSESNQRALRVGDSLAPGDAVTVGSGSALTLAYRDRTTVEFSGDTTFSLAPRAGGKGVRLTQGHLVATVAAQPRGRPMTFVTPQADVRVLGTRLLLAVTGEATRLDVTEGRVKFTRLDAPVSLEVSAGGYVLADGSLTLSANAIGEMAGETARVLEGHEGPLAWQHYPETGPLAFELSSAQTHSGKQALRVSYQPRADDPVTYAEILHPLALRPGDRALRFHIFVASSDTHSSWNIQFRLRDRSCWMISEGEFRTLSPGWQQIELDLRKPPLMRTYGSTTYNPSEADGLLFSVCVGSATFFLDDFTIISGEDGGD